MTAAKCSRPKTPSILTRRQKCFHHLSLNEVAVEAIQLVKPEVVPLEIERRFGPIVGVPSQVTEVLHQDKRVIEFLLGQRCILSYSPQCARPRGYVIRRCGKGKLVDDSRAVTRRRGHAGI